MDINQGSFTTLVNAVNSLGIPVATLPVIFGLIGTHQGELTTDVLYRAWTAYQSSPAYKNMGGFVARQAS